MTLTVYDLWRPGEIISDLDILRKCPLTFDFNISSPSYSLLFPRPIILSFRGTNTTSTKVILVPAFRPFRSSCGLEVVSTERSRNFNHVVTGAVACVMLNLFASLFIQFKRRSQHPHKRSCESLRSIKRSHMLKQNVCCHISLPHSFPVPKDNALTRKCISILRAFQLAVYLSTAFLVFFNALSNPDTSRLVRVVSIERSANHFPEECTQNMSQHLLKTFSTSLSRPQKAQVETSPSEAKYIGSLTHALKQNLMKLGKFQVKYLQSNFSFLKPQSSSSSVFKVNRPLCHALDDFMMSLSSTTK